MEQKDLEEKVDEALLYLAAGAKHAAHLKHTLWMVLAVVVGAVVALLVL